MLVNVSLFRNGGYDSFLQCRASKIHEGEKVYKAPYKAYGGTG